MKYIAFIITALALISPAPLFAQGIDLSTPERAYETCYSVVELSSETEVSAENIRACLTPTAQKTIMSYAVLGSFFLSSMKDIHGKQKHPGFASEIGGIIMQNKLKTASRNDLKKADLAQILSEIIAVYGAHPDIADQLHYDDRTLKTVEINGQTAKGIEAFSLKHPFPKNKLTLDFVQMDDKWLINHVSYK